MSDENIKALLEITENQIEYWKDFMAGEGNWDEFEYILYSSYIDGYLEDSLMFGRKILEILIRRKWRLKAKLERTENNDN